MSALYEVEVDTTLGVKYVFPDMEGEIIEQALRNIGAHSTLTLVNQSTACLVLPVRILQTVRVGGVEKWRRP